jgi:hypothetical protein
MMRVSALGLLFGAAASFLGCARGEDEAGPIESVAETVPANLACADAAERMYVLTDEGELMTFDPERLSFTNHGRVVCPDAELGAALNSMAVDRNGVAWLNFSDGVLFKLNLAEMRCERSTFAPQQRGFKKFGMAFGRTGDGETLFVSGLGSYNVPEAGGRGLARIDTRSLVLTPIGDYSGSYAGRDAELSGGTDGKLYGLFPSLPASLAEVSMETGATSNVVALPGVDVGTGFAFARFNSDFWIFTSPDLGPSQVTRYRPADRSTIRMLDDAGKRIVGASVSICAQR